MGRTTHHPHQHDKLECDDRKLGVRATALALEVVDVDSGKVLSSIALPSGTTAQRR